LVLAIDAGALDANGGALAIGAGIGGATVGAVYSL
jgi:hypothetical protein